MLIQYVLQDCQTTLAPDRLTHLQLSHIFNESWSSIHYILKAQSTQIFLTFRLRGKLDFTASLLTLPFYSYSTVSCQQPSSLACWTHFSCWSRGSLQQPSCFFHTFLLHKKNDVTSLVPMASVPLVYIDGQSSPFVFEQEWKASQHYFHLRCWNSSLIPWL